MIKDQNAVVLQHGVVLSQRLAPVTLLEQMGEGITKADHRIELSMDIAVEKAPIRLGRAQELIAITGIPEGPGKHVGAAIGTDNIKSFFQQTD